MSAPANPDSADNLRRGEPPLVLQSSKVFSGGADNFRRGEPLLGASLPARTGTASNTLGACTVSAAGTVKITGTLSKTLGACTVSSTGAVKVTGTLTKILGACTISSAGSVKVTCSLSKTIGAATCSATGAVKVTGTLSEPLGDCTVSATGTVASSGGGITGTLNKALGACTISATGTNNRVQFGGSGGKFQKYVRLIERVDVPIEGVARPAGLRLVIAMRRVSAHGSGSVSANRMLGSVYSRPPFATGSACVLLCCDYVPSFSRRCNVSAGASTMVKGSRLGDQLRNYDEDIEALLFLMSQK
jgi:hypothetical protein